MKFSLIVCSLLVWFAGKAGALDTKNGLQVEVSRKTVGRNDTRADSSYSSQQLDRTMALHVIAKNVSMKEMPEGIVEFAILVKKTGYYYTSRSGGYELYTGTEKLPALKVAESADVVIGAAQISGWRDAGEQHKDKLDYKITIKHGGKETIVVSTNPGFDAMAARAKVDH